jgi:glutaredoxin-related protein
MVEPKLYINGKLMGACKFAGELKSTAVAAIFGFPIDTMYIL